MPISSYDSTLLSLPFYNSHPYMLPFVGGDYDSPKHKKLLLIGESHYMPSGSSVHHNVNTWYYGAPKLSDDERDWCNTRGTREGKSGRFGKEIDRCLNLVLPSGGNGWHQVAFLNYFLRPADYQEGENEKGIEILWQTSGGKEIDCEFAIKNLIQVLEILKPDLFVLLSSNVKSCAEGEDYPKYFQGNLWNWTEKRNIEYCYTAHPSCSWWNRPMPAKYAKAGGLTSRDFFCAWLKQNWLK